MIPVTTVRNSPVRIVPTAESFLTNPQLPPTRPAISRAFQERIGGESTVRAYYDDSRDNAVAVVEAVGTPHSELTTYATASLHVCPNDLDGTDIRAELLLVGVRGQELVGNLLATAGFYVVKNRWFLAPGVVFPGLVTEYFPHANVKHLLWVEPFDFAGLASIRVDGFAPPVSALQGLPVTDEEWQLLRTKGLRALERTLTAFEPRHYDFERVSAV
ncbi:MAG: suppressor of fused domain protein [Nocardioides sp.]